jgi:hypothetical protein
MTIGPVQICPVQKIRQKLGRNGGNAMHTLYVLRKIRAKHVQYSGTRRCMVQAIVVRSCCSMVQIYATHTAFTQRTHCCLCQ